MDARKAADDSRKRQPREADAPAGMHPASCPCCGGGAAAATPGMEEFQRRLREMIEKKKEPK